MAGKPVPALVLAKLLARHCGSATVAAELGVAALHISEGGRASNSLNGEGPAQTVIGITMD